MIKGTLKGVIVGSGKKKAPQYNVLIKKLVLYCGEQGYQYFQKSYKPWWINHLKMKISMNLILTQNNGK